MAVLVASFVKGAIGFGFPAVATPLLALVVGVQTAVPVLILPNLVMDTIQVARRGGILTSARRLAVLLVFGAAGTVLGTWLLVVLPPRTARTVLGIFVLGFVALNVTPIRLRVAPGWERWLSPPVGLVAGVLGGLTNVQGTPLVIYFYALGMPKHEFVRSIAFAFIVYKLVQLAAVAWYGLITWRLLGASVGLTVLGLGAFALGLYVQDRVAQATFNRLILAFLALLATWLLLG